MNGGGYFPIPGLGNLNGGVYTDFTKGSLTGDRGGTWSPTRATATTSVDSSDLVVNISSGAPRWHRIGAGSGVTGIADWGAHTNIALQSEDFGTTWAALAATSPTRSAANATCGVVVLDLLGDDSALLAEGYTQTITFTGDAVKAVSIFVKGGTSANSLIRLRDDTGVANRLLASIAWSGGVPTPTMTTGTHEGTDVLAGGVYRLRFVTTSVTAANTNRLEVYPASDGVIDVTAQGNANFGGVMVQNATSVFPYVKTTTAAVTVNADVITLSGSGIINATEGTLWVEAVGPVDTAGTRAQFTVDDGTNNERVDISTSASSAVASVVDGGGFTASVVSAAAAWTAGTSRKAAARYRLNDSNVALNGTAGTADTSCTMPTTTTFRLGLANAGSEPNTVIKRVAYARTGANDTNLGVSTAP